MTREFVDGGVVRRLAEPCSPGSHGVVRVDACGIEVGSARRSFRQVLRKDRETLIVVRGTTGCSLDPTNIVDQVVGSRAGEALVEYGSGYIRCL